jgi:hypothetical protein
MKYEHIRQDIDTIRKLLKEGNHIALFTALPFFVDDVERMINSVEDHFKTITPEEFEEHLERED